MPITIKGIRIESVTITRDDDKQKVAAAEYSLISSADKVLAKQTIGGYSGMAIEPSPATVKALECFMISYRADVLAATGLDGSEW